MTATKEYMAAYRAANREKFREYAKRHIAKHGRRKLTDEEKEKQKEYMKDYQQANKKHLREMKKLQIAKNPKYAASLKQSKKEWREANPNYINEYNKRRKAVDPEFKLRMYLRSRINKAIRRIVKQGSAVKDLGCSIEYFKNYIELKFKSLMSWDNYGEWELDHIIPLAKFNLTIREEFEKACHYTNYQPLWKADNRAKRDN